MKKFLLPLLCLAALFAGVGCDDTADEDKTLFVSTDAYLPPYVFIVGRNDIRGIDVDIIKRAAKKMGLTLKIRNTAFNAVIHDVVSGRADVGIGGISITPERKKLVAFTIPYAHDEQVVIIRKGDTRITGVETLQGKIIGCLQSSAAFDVIRTKIPEQNLQQLLKTYHTPQEAVDALKKGEIDAVISDGTPSRALAKLNPETIEILPEPLYQDDYAMVVSKEHAKLAEEINSVINELRKSGEIVEIIEANRKLAAESDIKPKPVKEF